MLLTTSSHLCQFWAIFGYFWPFLATCDSFQPLLMTISYHSRLFLTSTKHFQPIPTTSSHFWPYSAILAIFGHFLATCDPFWPTPPTSDDLFWLLMTISNHLKVPNHRGRHLAGDYCVQLTYWIVDFGGNRFFERSGGKFWASDLIPSQEVLFLWPKKPQMGAFWSFRDDPIIDTG